MSVYSFRIHSLFMRTCIEIEANFKVILAENNCSRSGRQLNMVDHRRVDATHHLSSYEVMLPIWSGSPPTLRPFEQWRLYVDFRVPTERASQFPGTKITTPASMIGTMLSRRLI